MENQNNNQAVLAALGYPVLPQTVTPVIKTQKTVQRTQYDPNKLQAVVDALKTPTLRKSKYESLANALANTPEARSFIGAYGTEVINPWAVGLSSLARGFGSAYGDRLASDREAALKDQENALKAAQLEAEATKQAIQDQSSLDYIKYNDPNAGGDVSYRFEPERIEKMKKLNDEAGRWATEWGKGISDMANTEASQAYNEFEGMAKQYVQDQLKKIYGAQMTEQEGERFFKSMGLSPYLDPKMRWRLVENALNDVAHKNGLSLQPVQQSKIPQKGDVIDGYEFLGGDPSDQKNWRVK